MELCKVFGHGSYKTTAGELLTLRQGQQSVMDYVMDFRIAAS